LEDHPDGVYSVFADSGANDLAFDAAGNLFGANGNAILKFTPDGVGSVFAEIQVDPTSLARLSDLAFDSAGNLYAVQSNDSYGTGERCPITKITPDGHESLFPAPFLEGPGTPDGTRTRLAFTDDAGVPVLQPGGRLIPEPSTWALLGLGLPALLGFSRPRRSRVSP